MRSGTSRHVAHILLLLSAPLSATCSSPGNPAPGAPGVTAVALNLRVDQELDTALDQNPNTRRLVGSRRHHGQFHDIQRLGHRKWWGVRKSQYGPLVHVWSFSHIDDLKTVEDFSTARPVASISLLVPSGGMPDKYESVGDPEEVFGLGEQRSACVILRHNGNDPNHGWVATLLPGDCPEEPISATPTFAKTLPVVRETIIGADADAFPGVARLHWDSDKHKPLLGIKCADGWCIIGEAGTKADDNVCGRPRGYCDEQYLAIDGGDRLRPAKEARGTFIADDHLGRYTTAEDFECKDCTSQDPTCERCPNPGNWHRVASILLTGDRGEYMSQFGRITNGVNAVYLHQFSGAWFVKLVDARGNPSPVQRLKRVPHNPGDLVATARWGWSEADEGGWIRCGDGCCNLGDIL